MSAQSIGSPEAGGVDRIRELIEKHKLVAVFVGIEASFLLGALIADTVTIRVEEQGPALSDVTAGLLGGLAVVWILIGAVTYGVLLASNLYMRYQREM